MPQPREILDVSTTPDGQPLELARTGETYTIRVGHALLMSSAQRGSEIQLARLAAEALGPKPGARALIGGLGMGFTLRAALDAFDPTAQITVAELLPSIIHYNRGPLGPLADHPLDDPRTTLFKGDVRDAIATGGWDAIMLDVDNSPDALTAATNAHIYGPEGLTAIRRALKPGGVLTVWSATPDEAFTRALRRAYLNPITRRVYARHDADKGARHVIFVGQKR